MKATPKRLAIAGLGFIAVLAVCGLAAELIRSARDEERGDPDVLVSGLIAAANIAAVLAAALLVAAALAWVVKVGVRASRED